MYRIRNTAINVDHGNMFQQTTALLITGTSRDRKMPCALNNGLQECIEIHEILRAGAMPNQESQNAQADFTEAQADLNMKVFSRGTKDPNQKEESKLTDEQTEKLKNIISLNHLVLWDEPTVQRVQVTGIIQDKWRPLMVDTWPQESSVADMGLMDTFIGSDIIDLMENTDLTLTQNIYSTTEGKTIRSKEQPGQIVTATKTAMTPYPGASRPVMTKRLYAEEKMIARKMFTNCQIRTRVPPKEEVFNRFAHTFLRPDAG